MNVLNLLLLVVELLWFTPLSANWVFARVAKVKVLRGCFLIHLRYKHNLEMRVIFQSFFKTLPLLVRANAFMLFLFAYFCLSLTKAFKNEGYYCDNVDFEVANKQDCFDWGGDWVRQGINMSSYVASVDFKILFSTTEGWMTIMTDMMNFNGEGLAPSYNANEHFQVYFVAGFFLAGIFLLNIYISILLVGFRKAKEQLSGETKLTELQKQWLRVKSLICEMEPEPKKKPLQLHQETSVQNLHSPGIQNLPGHHVHPPTDSLQLLFIPTFGRNPRGLSKINFHLCCSGNC